MGAERLWIGLTPSEERDEPPPDSEESVREAIADLTAAVDDLRKAIRYLSGDLRAVLAELHGGRDTDDA